MIARASMNRFLMTVILSVLIFDSAFAGQVDDPAVVAVSWTDLAPDGQIFFDPFAKLSSQQLSDLSFVVRVRRLILEEKISSDGDDAQRAAQLARKLKDEGIDIPWLMVQRDRVRELRESLIQDHAASVAEKHDHKRVSLKGYAVPLKSENGLVTEFLLVPTTAMCSHESAPPPNQIVHVKSSQGVLLNDRRTLLNVVGTLQQCQSKHRYGISGMAESVYAIESAAIERIETSDESKTKPGSDRRRSSEN